MTPFLFKFLMAMRRWPTHVPHTSADTTSNTPSHINPYSKRFAGPNVQSASGFSLLEMIAIVVIVGILAAIAAPSWLGFANRQRVTATRNEVLQSIRTTQSTAKQRRRPQLLGFTPNSTDDIPTIRVAGVLTELGSGNLKADMVNMSVTDRDGNVLPTLTDDDGNVFHILKFRADGTVETEDPVIALPAKILFTDANEKNKRCIFIQTLLGSVSEKQESDTDCPAI